MDATTSWFVFTALLAVGYMMLRSPETKDSSKEVKSIEDPSDKPKKKKRPKKAKVDKLDENEQPLPEKPLERNAKTPVKEPPKAPALVNHALVNQSDEEEEEPEAPRVLILSKPKDLTARDPEWIQAGKSERCFVFYI